MLLSRDRILELPLERADDAQALAAELVAQIRTWVMADGSPDSIDVVRMLELAVLCHEAGMHFLVGAAIELADAGLGVGESDKVLL